MFCFPLFLTFSNSYAESDIINNPQFGSMINLGELIGERYSLKVDNQTFTIFYGQGGSLDDVAKQTEPALVSEMNINQESKSLDIKFEVVPETESFWLILPDEVITSEKGKFVLIIDDVEKGYELANIKEGYSMAFILPQDTQEIKIIGTEVVPEFGITALLVFTVSILGVLIFSRKISIGNIQFFKF